MGFQYGIVVFLFHDGVLISTIFEHAHTHPEFQYYNSGKMDQTMILSFLILSLWKSIDIQQIKFRCVSLFFIQK